MRFLQKMFCPSSDCYGSALIENMFLNKKLMLVSFINKVTLLIIITFFSTPSMASELPRCPDIQEAITPEITEEYKRTGKISSNSRDYIEKTTYHKCQTTRVYDDGTYTGEFLDGSMHGVGIKFTTNGNYDGEFKNNKYDGQGKRTYKSGNIYAGGWKEGEKNGEGSLTFTNGDRYEGTYMNDEPYGKGTYNYVNGDLYTGEFKVYTKHGLGTYTYADGRIEEGIFRDGEFVVSKSLASNPVKSERFEIDFWIKGYIVYFFISLFTVFSLIIGLFYYFRYPRKNEFVNHQLRDGRKLKRKLSSDERDFKRVLSNCKLNNSELEYLGNQYDWSLYKLNRASRKDLVNCPGIGFRKAEYILKELARG